jgi:osmotically-inducible protein OsmY
VEKARVEDDARMATPNELDATGLRVDRWTDDGTLRARPPLSRSDREIGQTVFDAYVADPRVHPFVPTIDVRDHVVILTGVAPNAETKAAARQDAENTTGVLDVRDDTKLMTGVVHRTDAEIRAEVLDALARDGLLRRLRLSVEVVDGCVYLRGKVHSETDRLHAIALSTSARGTRRVDDGLELVPQLGAASMQPPR